MKHNKSIYKIGTLALMLLASGGAGYAQKKQQKVKENVSIQVVDKSGKAIPGAEIVVGEGTEHLQTDEKGQLSFKGYASDWVSISEPGYTSVKVSLAKLLTEGLVTLDNYAVYSSEEDNIVLPYTQTNKHNSTGDYIVLTGEDLKKYPSLDLRNAFVGLVPGLSITESDGSTGILAEERFHRKGGTGKINEYMRGGMPMYIIDDVPSDITEMPLDPEEIETVTFIKDVVGKTLYGPRAANGVILIKTKRGKSNERLLNVSIEGGLSVVDRFPEWASGADYARMNNMARQNDGMNPLYSDEAIAKYGMNDPYDYDHPSINFKDLMFKNTKSYQKVNLSSSGGNDFVKYYASLGYAGEGDIYKVGSTAAYNRVNARSNLDMKVNDFITVQVGLFGGISSRKSPNYEYDTEDMLEFKNAIDDIISTSPIAYPLLAGVDEESGMQRYGVSPSFKTNPYANLVGCGYYTETGRSGRVNLALNISLDHIVKGLSSRTFFDFSVYNMTRIGKEERFAGYSVTPNAEGNDYIYKQLIEPKDASGESKFRDYYFQKFSGYQSFMYNRKFADNHAVNANLTYALSKFTRAGYENPFNEQNVNLGLAYSYKNKYNVNGAVSFAGTTELVGDNQYKFFPSIGASWVISEEDFMKDIKFLDFLKLRAEWGMLGMLTSDPRLFHYENKWQSGSGEKFGPHSNNKWMGGSGQWTPHKTYYNKWKNPNLDWEVRKELSVGIDALMFNKRLALGVTYYNVLHDNQWVKPVNMFPSVSGLQAIPYMNYNQTRYFGAETAAKWTDKVGDLKYSVGATVSLPRTKRVRYDEPNYREEYLRHEGLPTDAYFGLIYDGVYQTDEEAQSVNQQYDAELHKGDFKYVDVNHDGNIDDNDKVNLGNTSPKVFYALNLGFEYKNFELHVVADGKAGFNIVKDNRYFQNGWGDGNYSKYVVDNVGGDYPRLTYNKVSNNFQNSSYWLMKGNYFKIQNVELAYNFRCPSFEKIGLEKVRFFVRGANLLTISGVKDIDPESPDSGIDRYPLNKTFTGGFSLTF